MYDVFAYRYGLTLDQFYSMTSRQIAAIAPVIETRSHKAFEVKAALHGKKVKPRPEANLLNVDEETDKAQDKDAQDLYDRMKQRFISKKVKAKE